MKIGIDYTAAIHQSAGIGRYTREMVKAVAQAANSDFEPQYRLFVADAGKMLANSLPGPNFAWSPTRITERWLARLWYRLRLPLPIQYWTGPIDLYHTPDFFLPPVKRRTHTLVTVHDLSFVREPDTTMLGMSRQLNTWVPRSVERADHVIAVSQATKQDLIDLYHTPPEKISVLYHGVTPNFNPIQNPEKLKLICQKYHLGDQPFILSVGTLQPRKNYRRLIQAFAQLDTPASLVIAGGKGWHYQEIFAEVNQHRLQERVRFPGFIDDDDLPGLYSAAALFVYPSLYEGFGLPVLEAMACGTPVIASNTSALPEVVGKAGLLVNPLAVEAMAGAMAKVLNNADLSQKLSQAGLKQASKFSWTNMAEKLIKLYKKILKEE